MNVYCIRHPETIWNRTRRLQGHLDSPLTDLGRATAQKLGQALCQYSIEWIGSSDLGRCRETAQIVNESLRCSIQFFAELREQNFGDLNGRSDDYVDQHLDRRDPDFRPPGGETPREHLDRLLSFFDWLATQPYTNVLVVTHSASMVCLLAAYYECDLTDSRCRVSDHDITRLTLMASGFDLASLERIHLS